MQKILNILLSVKPAGNGGVSETVAPLYLNRLEFK